MCALPSQRDETNFFARKSNPGDSAQISSISLDLPNGLFYTEVEKAMKYA
jgi:hypothetical protein